MPNREATSVIFGFDFQANAAIVLALENINNLQSLRLESSYEDIDITLFNGSHILAQAKSVTEPLTDFRNVRRNLTKALTSLSEGCTELKQSEINCSDLIYITNSRNPLNQAQGTINVFEGKTNRQYYELPPVAQEIIDNIITNEKIQIEKSLFTVYLLPFETDNRNERYKAIIRVIDDFLGTNNIQLAGLSNKILEKWTALILTNGSTRDTQIVLRKKDLIWPIINIIINPDNLISTFRDYFDESEYSEIIRNYITLIEQNTERVESFTKVIYEFSQYRDSSIGNQKILNFAEKFYGTYIDEFLLNELPIDIQEKLSKVIIYCILTKRHEIDKLKKGANICD